MQKTVSPIDNKVYVEREYHSNKIEETLNNTVKAQISWSHLSVKERVELYANGKTVTGIVTTGIHNFKSGIPVAIGGISSTTFKGLEGTYPISVKFVRSGLGTSLLASGMTTTITLLDDVDIFDNDGSGS